MLEILPVNEKNQLWPYLLFLPQDPATRDEFIRTILASSLARNVFLSFDEEGKAYQRDMIHNLPHSNKSILKYLEKLGNYGLIKTETTVRGGKRVVYHELTDNGKGIASFFFKELPSDLGVLTASLLENYLLRLVSLYRNQGMSESVIFDVFTKTRGLAILDGSIKYQNPEFMLFGASAFYTQIDCDSIPGVGGLESCDIPSRYPGGPSVELALALAEVGRQVTFVSEVGNDQDGYNIISHLVQNKVDVTNVKVENDLRTNETIIINDKTGSRQLIGYGDTSALSVPSLKEVPWSLLEESKVVYIGEVFVEIALSIANTANQNDIPLIYRPSILFLERGLDTIEPILKQTDFLILSQRALNFIKTGIKNSSMKRLRNLTKGSIIVRDSTDSYSVVNKNEETFTKSCGNQTQDITQWFVAGFLEGIVSGLDSYDSINKGIELEASKFIA
jgi:sugar/nucleoside kinase (ribokinase family)